MLVGEKNNFAVEYELDANSGGCWLFGRICYWINDISVGDYSLGTSLRDVLINLTYLVGDCGDRCHNLLFELPSSEAFIRVHDALFEHSATYGRVADEEHWARFNVTIPVDVFDGWQIFLIETVGEAKLLVGRCSLSSGRYKFAFDMRIPIGKFDQTIREFATQLEALYRNADPVRPENSK